MISADTLVLLADIDGFYTGDPRSDASAILIPEIREITPAIEAMAGAAASEPAQRRHGDQADRRPHRHGRGLPHGDRRRPRRGRAGQPDRRQGALQLVAARLSLSARKKWIKGWAQDRWRPHRRRRAVRALSAGKGLLPAGVTSVDGEFRRGDVVDVKDRLGRVLARGLVAYAAEDARRIAGRKSTEIERLLGFRGRDEMVHRDDLVVDHGLYWSGR